MAFPFFVGDIIAVQLGNSFSYFKGSFQAVDLVFLQQTVGFGTDFCHKKISAVTYGLADFYSKVTSAGAATLACFFFRLADYFTLFQKRKASVIFVHFKD